MQAGICFLCAWYCDVATALQHYTNLIIIIIIKWRIHSPNSSSSFEVSAIFGDGNYDDICVWIKDSQSIL